MLGLAFLILFGAAIIGVLVIHHAQRRHERSTQVAALTAIAPVMAGTVSGDRKLAANYRGRAVMVWFERIDPQPRTAAAHQTSVYVHVLRMRLEAGGVAPWSVRSEPILGLPLGRSRYEFVNQPALELASRLPFPGTVIAAPDRSIQQRLRGEGLFEALGRVSPPQPSWLPRASFAPDPRPAMLASFRQAGIPVPRNAMNRAVKDTPNVGLMIDIPRGDVRNLTADRFRTLLDGLVAVAELNERVNVNVRQR